MEKKFMDKKVRDSLGGYGFIVEYDTLNIRYINEVWRNKIPNIVDDSYIGQKCYKIFYNLDAPCENCYKKQLRYDETIRTNRFIESSIEHYIMDNTLFNENGVDYILTIAYDISDEMKEINLLKEHIKLDTAILNCAKTLVYEDDFDVAIQTLLHIICDFNEADHTLLFERDYNKNITAISYSFSKDESIFDNETKDSYVFSLSGKMSGLEKAFQNLPYVFVESDDLNLENYGYCSDILKKVGHKNLLLVPLKIDRVVVGSIVVVNVNDYSPSFQLLTAVSTFISNNLNIKYARKKLEKMVVSLAAKIELNDLIIDAMKTLIEVEDIEIADSIETLLKIISNHFKTQGVYVFELNDNKENLFNRFEYLKGLESNVVDFTQISTNVINRWFRTYQKDDIIYIKSVKNELQDNTTEYEWLISKKVNSFIATPLYQNSEITGYLWLDNPTRNFEDISVVKTIATLIISHTTKYDLMKQLEHLSYTDDLTGLYNRNFFMKYIQQINLLPRQNIGVIFADVNGLKKTNDNLGHEYGDVLIKWCSKFFKKYVHGYLFRIGGDEFVAVIEKVDFEYFNQCVENMQKELEDLPAIHLSFGSVWEKDVNDIQPLITKADELMYENKTNYYKEKELQQISLEEELKHIKKAIMSLK